MRQLSRLLDQVHELGLPADSFAVFGSGPMAAAGIRDVNDLDLIVTPELWADLERNKPVSALEGGGHVIQIGSIEIHNGWEPPIDEMSTLIDEAEVIGGVRFVRLEEVLKWKRKRSRPKDEADIALIEKYLDSSGPPRSRSRED